LIYYQKLKLKIYKIKLFINFNLLHLLIFNSGLYLIKIIQILENFIKLEYLKLQSVNKLINYINKLHKLLILKELQIYTFIILMIYKMMKNFTHKYMKILEIKMILKKK
jgi:hypothetical protein